MCRQVSSHQPLAISCPAISNNTVAQSSPIIHLFLVRERRQGYIQKSVEARMRHTVKDRVACAESLLLRFYTHKGLPGLGTRAARCYLYLSPATLVGVLGRMRCGQLKCFDMFQWLGAHGRC